MEAQSTAADSVSYEYGGQNAPGNGAGQVVSEQDGSRIAHNSYDAAGNLVQQTATIKLHDWTPAADQSKFTWTTKWSYDGLGRMKSMVYPDATPLALTAEYNNGQATGLDSGERLAYDYDAGGQLKAISGQEDGVQTKQVGVDAPHPALDPRLEIGVDDRTATERPVHEFASPPTIARIEARGPAIGRRVEQFPRTQITGNLRIRIRD